MTQPSQTTPNARRRGVLIREVSVRLLEVSLSGCLLESRSRIQPGIAGHLRLQIDGEEHCDDVRVGRCVMVEGSGSRYRSGAEFLWSHRSEERSLRRAVCRIEDPR